MPILEVCTGSLQSVINAVKGGAQRIELCSALSLDGLTPSLGLIKTVRKMFPKLTIHTLIRVREGDFCYNEGEIKVMETDIKEILSYTDAIVCGALTADGDIDIATTRRLIDACEGKPFTFHRAFDVCRNPLKALDELAALHCRHTRTERIYKTHRRTYDHLARRWRNPTECKKDTRRNRSSRDSWVGIGRSRKWQKGDAYRGSCTNSSTNKVAPAKSY